MIPLIIFASGPLNVFTDQNQYELSVGISLTVLFVLGSLKSRFGSGGWFYCGLETMVLGVICAGVSYFVGDSIMSFIALT